MSSSAPNMTQADAPTTGRYFIDPERTTVRFSTRHMFGLGRVSGTVRLLEAELVVGDPTTTTTLRASLDAASFDTGNARRDADVRSEKYLDTATYPDIAFTCADILERGGHWFAPGIVTAHGVSAPVDVTVEGFTETPAEVTFRARARIDRYAHLVLGGKGLAGRWLSLDISAVASR